MHRLALWIALGFGSGRSPVAPGTVGSLWGWASWIFLGQAPLSTASLGLVVLVAVVLGVWACGLAAEQLGQDDPGCIVWDEVAAVWLVLWMLPEGAGLGLQAVAVVLFRFFDIAKPAPIRSLEVMFVGRGLAPRLATGLGVMVDDLMAAAYALLALSVLLRLGWVGL